MIYGQTLALLGDFSGALKYPVELQRPLPHDGKPLGVDHQTRVVFLRRMTIQSGVVHDVP